VKQFYRPARTGNVGVVVQWPLRSSSLIPVTYALWSDSLEIVDLLQQTHSGGDASSVQGDRGEKGWLSFLFCYVVCLVLPL
jgi:hypothetical protein